MQTVDDFYTAEARRDSREIRFGSGWRSTRVPEWEFSLFWIAATEELCLLRAPLPDVESDGVVNRFIFGIPPHTNPKQLRDEDVTIEVLATVPESALSDLLGDWESRHAESDGVEWLRSRVGDHTPG